MSDTHPGDFDDPKNIFGNLVNRVSDTHKVLSPVHLFAQVYRW